MIKNTVIALLTAATLVGAAAPAFADTETGYDNAQNEDVGSRNFASETLLNRLQQQGVNATAVENWGGLVRAYVTLEDGSQVMQLFVPGSLEQVAL